MRGWFTLSMKENLVKIGYLRWRCRGWTSMPYVLNCASLIRSCTLRFPSSKCHGSWPTESIASWSGQGVAWTCRSLELLCFTHLPHARCLSPYWEHVFFSSNCFHRNKHWLWLAVFSDLNQKNLEPIQMFLSEYCTADEIVVRKQKEKGELIIARGQMRQRDGCVVCPG